MEILRFPQEVSSIDIKRQIIELENLAWPKEDKDIDVKFPTEPETYVTSIILLESNKLLSHVAIRRKTISHKGISYIAYGLSEMVTHPDYQNRGLGSLVLKKAEEFISEQNPDVSLFTCFSGVEPFYLAAGWNLSDGSTLVGGTIEKPFRSDQFDLKTMIRFYSENAKMHASDFSNADIFIELGENKLW